jgi:hypothetical protein
MISNLAIDLRGLYSSQHEHTRRNKDETRIKQLAGAADRCERNERRIWISINWSNTIRESNDMSDSSKTKQAMLARRSKGNAQATRTEIDRGEEVLGFQMGNNIGLFGSFENHNNESVTEDLQPQIL